MTRSAGVLASGLWLREAGVVLAVVRRASGRIEPYRASAPDSALRRLPLVGDLIGYFDGYRFGLVPNDWAAELVERDLAGDDAGVPPFTQPTGVGGVVHSLVFGAAVLSFVGLIQEIAATRLGLVHETVAFDLLAWLLFVGLYALHMTLIGATAVGRSLRPLGGAVGRLLWALDDPGVRDATALQRLPWLHPATVGASLPITLLVASVGVAERLAPVPPTAFAQGALRVALGLVSWPLAVTAGSALGLRLAGAARSPGARSALAALAGLARFSVREPGPDEDALVEALLALRRERG